MRQDLVDMADLKGRINYGQLTQYVRRQDRRSFIRDSRHPYLVGQDLCEGALASEPLGSATNTIPFRRSDLVRAIRGEELEDTLPTGGFPRAALAPNGGPGHASIAHAIFMLRKRQDTNGRPNEILLGRGQDNDVIIADYAVSSAHAMVTIEYETYYVTDRNSTNGTTIDGARIPPGKRQPLPLNARISFGRLIFRFYPPGDLFDLLSAEV